MSEDHIGVQINGVLYVKFEDAKKLREGWDKADDEIEKLRAALIKINELNSKRLGYSKKIERVILEALGEKE